MRGVSASSLHPFRTREARRLAAFFAAVYFAQGMWYLPNQALTFFFNFSPSFGPALLFYQTDVLGFSQSFIGHLAAWSSIAAVAGAFVYAPLSRQVPLVRLINWSIGASVIATLAYLGYRDAWSAAAIEVVFGGIGMLTQLAFLDLAARACPRHVEATVFALLMSVYNGGAQLSQNVGGRLYDWYGYTPLVLISAVFTALAWALVPLAPIDRIVAESRAAADEERLAGAG